MRPGLRILLVFAAVAAAAGAAPGAARAADGPALSAEMQGRLMALEPLRGAAVDRGVFDGRPVLVKFFASW